jgi:UDP-N-acetylmuramoylalanine--D-glutamate ligase
VNDGISSFTGVRNRMELVAEIDGVIFINDSAATAPIAAIANLSGLADRRVHHISGGHDKQTDLVPLADALVEMATSVHLLAGSATPALQRLIEDRGGAPSGPHDTMQAAVRYASGQARAGDIVLLSPGCASFGLFRDEFDRGDQFRDNVFALRTERTVVS